MNMHAGFLKRLFAFIIDVTLVIVVTWLLYLFPFQMIINNIVDEDYKNNIKTKYDAITEKYDGVDKVIGGSTSGLNDVLLASNTAGSLSETEHAQYRAYIDQAYNLCNDEILQLIDDLNVPYNAETSESEQFYSKVYLIYTYVYNSYEARSNFKGEWQDGEYVRYSDLGKVNKLDSATVEEKESAYDTALLNEFLDQTTILITALKNYDELNDDIDITDNKYFSDISSVITGNRDIKIDDISATLTEENVNTLKNTVKSYYDYFLYATTKEKMGSTTTEGIVSITFTDEDTEDGVNYGEAYLIFWYNMNVIETNEKLPYNMAVIEHSTWDAIYSLAMFTLIFSIYTMAMRGYTLGRRSVQIKLVGPHEMDKTNPLLALLHDVLFRFLYAILLGMLFNLLIVICVLLIFAIVDAILIKFTKSHKAIRDHLSMTRVILLH